VKKATDQAKRNMIRIPLRDGRTLHHDVKGHFGAGRVVMRNAPTGTGIIAGGPMRAVFECVGIQDVVAKVVGTNNPYNMVNATFKALKMIQSPRQVASRRGKKISDVVAQREGTKAGEASEEEQGE
jgi:small subunit ribosomal protein S5